LGFCFYNVNFWFKFPPPPPTNTTLSSPPTNTWGTTWGVYHVAEQALYEDKLTLLCMLCGLDSHTYLEKNTEK
jgi:hypothetical protein